MRGAHEARLITLAALALAACGGGAEANDAGERTEERPPPVEAPAGTTADTGIPDTAGVEGAARTQEAGADGAAVEAPGREDLITISVAGIPVRVEVADEAEERQQGLMYRDSLPDGEGMLFVYEEERTLSFWMRNTQIPLDIAFLDRSGRIVDIRQLEPFDEEGVESRRPAMYALEVRRGWFEENGVRVGDRVEL